MRGEELTGGENSNRRPRWRVADPRDGRLLSPEISVEPRELLALCFDREVVSGDLWWWHM